MFFSCNAPDSISGIQNQIRSRRVIVNADTNRVLTLDAFVFEPTGRLDCYQRIHNPDNKCEIASGAGDKTILLIANSNRERYEWTDIRTLSSIQTIYSSLEDERRDYPLMTWMQEIKAGQETAPEFCPSRCEIILRSLRSDFSGLPYANESFHAVKAYLTYVNANCSIIPIDGITHPRFLNAGMLNDDDIFQFIERDIIMQDIGQTVNKEKVILNRSFLCYANEPGNESVGSPFTRLVIEGKIGDDTYYYPIKVNAESGGLRRGCRYILDIFITRAGATDPDGSLELSDIKLNMEVEEWKEKANYTVGF